MFQVTRFTDKTLIKQLDTSDKFNAIEELAKNFNKKICTDIEALIDALIEREELMSTGIGFGLAIPHVKIKSVKKISFAIGISKRGIDFDSMDGTPAHLIILVVAGEDQHKKYLNLLSNIMYILKKENVKERIINSDSSEEIINILHSDG